jgi:hypothetical protein
MGWLALAATRVMTSWSYGREAVGDELVGWLRTCADVLALVEAAAHRGATSSWWRRSLSARPWLYAGLVGELADHLVLCVEEGVKATREVALPVLDRYDCPAPIVLLGGRASHLDRVRVRARALLELGSGGGDLRVPAPCRR